MYVIDGLLHNDSIASNVHSTDTHGYTEMVFADELAKLKNGNDLIRC